MGRPTSWDIGGPADTDFVDTAEGNPVRSLRVRWSTSNENAAPAVRIRQSMGCCTAGTVV